MELEDTTVLDFSEFEDRRQVGATTRTRSRSDNDVISTEKADRDLLWLRGGRPGPAAACPARPVWGLAKERIFIMDWWLSPGMSRIISDGGQEADYFVL